jgi:2-dehydropantoate 2-reductase
MKIVMMGAGGVGGFFGGRLAKAGYDVSFVARGAHLKALREHGLTIENATAGRHPRAAGARDRRSRELGPADLVILSVKLWDTEAAARAIKPIVGPRPACSRCRTASSRTRSCGASFPSAQVMGGVGYVATHISRPA